MSRPEDNKSRIKHVVDWLLLLLPWTVLWSAIIVGYHAQTDAGLNANTAFHSLMLFNTAIFFILVRWRL